jgi:hypothetical protein
MKKAVKWLAIIACAVIIGGSFVACEDDSAKDELDGTTWKSGTYVLTFNSPNVTLKSSDGSFTGTYSISGNTVTISFGDEIETAVLSGNTLTVDEEMVFTKQ